MPTEKLITSEQIVRVGDLASFPLRTVIGEVAKKLGVTCDEAQTALISCGGNFQAELLLSLGDPVEKLITKFIGRKHHAAEDVEKYIHEVYGGKVDLTGKLFPEKNGFPVYMARPDGLDEDFALAQIIKRFSVGKYTYLSPVAENINRNAEQKRPDGTYVFAHVGGDEPDAKHLGKSYDNSVGEKIVFANSFEYLLMTGFHMWKHEKWMDVKGWTRLSSLWSDGRAVDGYFYPDNQGLCLRKSHRDFRSAKKKIPRATKVAQPKV